MSPSWFRREPESEIDDEQVWQKKDTAYPSFLARIGRYAAIFGLTLLLVGAAGLIGWIVMLMLAKPLAAPVIAVQSAAYRWPLPPNSWTEEDIRDLAPPTQALQDRTFSLLNPAARVRTKQDVFDIIDQAIQSYTDVGDWSTAIFYVSMHGTVEGQSPFLIPPSASPYEPSTWIELAQLIDHINAKFPENNKLVVLDCSRLRSSWHLGMPHNDFADGLQKWWDSQAGKYERLAVLSSAGPRQQGWASSDLRGSVFGHYFRLGLAGAANMEFPEGRSDRKVSVVELHQYLKDRVGTWVQRRYGRQQAPVLLLPENVKDFQVVESLRPNSLEALINEDSRFTPAKSPVSAVKLHDIWKAMDKIRAFGAYRFEPLQWRSLEHQAIWLEQLTAGGSAYEALARRVAAQLATQTQEIQTRLGSAQQGRSVSESGGIIGGEVLSVPEGLELSSLPLAQYFEAVDPDSIKKMESVFSTFSAAPNEDSLTRSLARLEQLGSPILAEHQFMRMLQRYQVPRLWQQSSMLRELLRIQRQADRLAVPSPSGGGDERVHYWVRPLLADADAVRRQAEDLVFLDGQSSLQDKLGVANTKYSAAELSARQLSDVVRLRDQACAEIPYFCQWLTDPLRTFASSQEYDNSVNQVLIPLIKNTAALGELLADHSTLPADPASQATASSARVAASIEQIRGLGRRVETGLTALHQGLDQECQRLADSSVRVDVSDADECREIVATLQIPLLSATQRSNLQTQLAETSKRLRNDSTRAIDQDQAAVDELDTEVVNVSRRPGDDLARALLTAAGAASAQDESPVQDQWRQGIRQLLDDIADLGETYEQLTGAETRDETDVRRHWSGVERRLRSVAPYWFPNQPAADPIRVLRGIDLRRVLVWHGHRTLDDLWGAAGQPQPFFETATEGYVRSARQLPTSYSSKDVAVLETRLLADRRAAASWMETMPAEAVLMSDEDEAQVPISVEPNPSTAPGLPSGTAVLFQRQGNKRVAKTVFDQAGAISLPEGGTRSTTLNAQAIPSPPTSLLLETMFRGHEFRAPLGVKRMGGVLVTHEPYVYEQSQITLQNPWKKLSVVFVLDCSSSMGNAMDGNVTRLQVAREALQEMLDELAGRKNVRIGVRCFGHRLGWTTDPPVRLLTSPYYQPEIPSGLRPDEDIEQIMPLSDFDYAAARNLYPKLDSLAAWGQSPLYLSLDRALAEDFVDEGTDADRHIVVLTDGRDYQYRPLVGNRRSVGQIIQAARQQGVPIHILGLAMDAEEQQQVAPDFSRIGQSTGGIYRNLTTSTDLFSALRSIFAPETYRLYDATGRLVDEAVLGAAVSEIPAPETPRVYSLEFPEGRETLWLAGGEALSLFNLPRQSQVYAFPYEHDVQREVPLLMAGRPQPVDLLARLHRPVRIDRDVQLPISVQRLADTGTVQGERRWRWTQRPAEAWVEVTPYFTASNNATGVSLTDPAGETFFFYDTNYEPDKPVPELRLTARDWPVGATAARVAIWLKAQESNPSAVVRLVDVVDNPEKRMSFALTPMPGVQIDVDSAPMPPPARGVRLRVIERHDDRSAGVGSLKVLAPSGDQVRLVRITRQFDADNGLAVHTFEYGASEDLETRLREAEIGFVSRDDALRDSWRPADQDQFVLISDAGFFLPMANR